MGNLKFDIVSKTSRTITIELINDECYSLKNEVSLFLNEILYSDINKNVYTIEDLEQDTEYEIYLEDKQASITSEKILVRTVKESYVLNVKDFGAKGDGETLDTTCIQAAIECCPKDGRVVIPEGEYFVGPIFLKSNITIELQKGAVLKGDTDRTRYPIIPAIIKNSTNPEDEFYLNSWEGQPDTTFASLITGINVENCNIIGNGILDGNADATDWWQDYKKKRISWRPKTIFLNNCTNILFEGITVRNSPSWTIHPLRSKDLKFINLSIENPKISPNTDGLDPESCENLLILGVYISVGDDCIAIKAGRHLDEDKFTVCRNLEVRNCNMSYGHGGVVIGSEMSGDVKEVYVERCLFNLTDRGIRLKTRRGRGGSIDEIYAKNIKMERVRVPFTVNSFYYCDPDGRTEYVWSKEILEINEKTPEVGNVYLKDIHCAKTEIAAGFAYGLPERKIRSINMENIYIDYADNVEPDYPEMMDNIEPVSRSGLYFNNVKYLSLKNIKINNASTEDIVKINIDEESY